MQRQPRTKRYFRIGADSGELRVTSVRRLVAAGGKLYAATVRGLFNSDDNGGSWRESNAGLGSLRIRSIAAVLYLTTDQGTAICRSRDGGENWVRVAQWTSEAGVRTVAVDPRDPSRVLREARLRTPYVLPKVVWSVPSVRENRRTEQANTWASHSSSPWFGSWTGRR